jgi:WD40 repeat protein
MPPEQASPERAALGPRSDVYSLGAVLYHALTGRPPFQGESLEAVLTQLLTSDPVPPRLLNPAAPRDLETVCLKCLIKEPPRRYETAEALAEELGRFLRNEPILAKPASRTEKLWRWCRRKPALASALGLLLLVGTVGATLVLWQWRRAENAATERQSNLYAADMELAFRAFAAGDLGNARRLLANHLPGPQTRGRDLRGWEWRYLWQQSRGQESFTLGQHAGAVMALDYAPDGGLLASADVRGVLRIWDPVARRELLSTNVGEGRINALAFAPDGRLLAHTTARDRVWLWDTRRWTRLGALPQLAVSELAFSPDGKVLAVANGLEVVLWSVEAQQKWKSLPSEDRPGPKLLGFTPDGNALVVAYTDGVVVPWDWRKGTHGKPWLAHRAVPGWPETVEGLACSPVGFLVATSGGDKRVRLAKVNPFRHWILSNHTEAVLGMAFSPDGRRLVSGSQDQTVRLWDVATQRELTNWHAHAGGCRKVRFAPDGRSFASGGADGTVKLWSLQPATTPETTVKLLPQGVEEAVVYSDSGTVAMKTTHDWRVWSLPTFAELRRGEYGANHYFPLRGVASGRMLECDGRTIQFRRVADGLIEPFVAWDGGVSINLDLSRNGQVLAASSEDWIGVWDVPTKKRLRRWETPRAGVGRYVRVCPDGAWLVTLQKFDGQVEFLHIATGQKVPLSGHMIRASVIEFSPEGQRMAVAGVGSTIRIYHVRGRREMAALETSLGFVTALAFSPDEKRLACGSAKGPITLWDLQTRREVAWLAGHQRMVYSLAFLDADMLASATSEEVRLWRAPGLRGIDQEIAGNK